MLLLASNENPLGMPQSARHAAVAALDLSGNYPDGDGTKLKGLLSERLGVEAGWLALGSGSSELLELAAQACLEPGAGVVYSQYGFVVYAQATSHARGRHIVVPASEFGHDLPAMARAVDDGTRLVFVANPNNPTGSFVQGDRLLAFLEQMPVRVTVLLDEAYTEYLAPAQRYDSIGWVRRFPNLIVTRTFSKAYGLAGLRIGYAVAQPALAARLNARRPRFNITTPALAAAAAALQDEDFVRQTRELNAQGREQLASELTSLGLRCLPSSGNFVMVRAGDAPGMHSHLLARGIAVSRLDNYGLDEWLRITVGLPQQNLRVLEAIAEYSSAAAQRA